MKRYLGIFILGCLSGHVLLAQVNLTNMYNQNYYLINAASTGQNNCWDLYTGYRSQWTGVKNSPSRSYISMNGRIGKSQGLGVFVEQSKAGLLSYLNGKVSYAYHVALRANSTLHIGVSVGFNHQKFDAGGVTATDYSDDVLTGNQSSTAISSDLGVMFTARRLLLGVALPQLLHSNTTSTSEHKTDWYKYFIVHGSYNIVDNETWLLQGVVLYRSNANVQGHVADIGSRLLWRDQYGLSAGYRTNNGLFIKSEIKVSNRISLAYSFEFGASKSRKSQEVMLGIRFCKKKKPEIEHAPDDVQETPPSVREEETKPIEQDTLSTRRAEDANAEPVVNNKIKKGINLDSLNREFAVSDKLIMFELNSSDKILSDNRDEVLNAVVEIMHENPELKIMVVGHSCKLGSSELNMEISEARAKLIADDLVRRGISTDVITYTGKGETEPVTSGSSPTELSRNRRVQILFSIK